MWGVDNQYEEAENPCYATCETGNIDYFIGMVSINLSNQTLYRIRSTIHLLLPKVPYELSDYMYWLRADIDSWRESASELTFVEGPLEQWTDEV